MKRLRHRLGWLPISVLMLPILAWVWPVARGPVRAVFSGAVPWYVISGKLFTERFDTVHAGCAMDQPTIGKWLFWFTFMTATSLPYVAVVGWLANRRKPAGRIAFGVCTAILCVFLLCILSVPFFLLVQYVWSLGWTPARAFGMLYFIVWASLLAGLQYWATRKPREAGVQEPCCPNCGYNLTGNTSGTCPECGTSRPEKYGTRG